MGKKRQYTKESMDNAIKFVTSGGSVRQASKKFDVPRSSIQFKLLNPLTKFKSGPDPVLTEAEETTLCNHVLLQAKRGFPMNKEDVKLEVQEFLKKNPRPNPFKNNKPGDAWFQAFLKRFPVISIRTSEGVTNSSSCVSKQDIQKWFQEIRDYLQDEKLADAIADPTRVYNADETGFNLCPKTGKVLAEKGSKNVYQIEKGSSKENITVLFTFSAAGFTCSPLIIYPYKRIPDKVTMSVPSGWGIGRSDSGWMTAAVFCDYIANCLYPELLANNVTFPVILFVDGHKSHVTIQVSELCRSLKIHLIALYPNATRILQPADVAAFRPIKLAWKKGLSEWYAKKNYEQNLNKEAFAPLLKSVVETSIKESTLINGFRVTGLFPFNEHNVDYSKCISTKEKSTTQQQNETTEQNMASTLSYREFCDIVGEEIVEQCQKVTRLDCMDKNFLAVYRLWKRMSEGMKRIPHVETETECLVPETIGKASESDCIPSICIAELHSTSIYDPGPSTSTSSNKKITIISNESLEHYLKRKPCPASPKRKIKHQTEKVPFALTSDGFLQLMKAKTLKKQEEEAAKENRKRMRVEKKNQKENNVPKKKPKKILAAKDSESKMNKTEILDTQNVSPVNNKPKKHLAVVCCDACLNPIIKRIIQCSQCNQQFHQNCVPSFHRKHIPEDDEDSFLCHQCFHCSNTDSSEGDELFEAIFEESRK